MSHQTVNLVLHEFASFPFDPHLLCVSSFQLIVLGWGIVPPTVQLCSSNLTNNTNEIETDPVSGCLSKEGNWLQFSVPRKHQMGRGHLISILAPFWATNSLFHFLENPPQS